MDSGYSYFNSFKENRSWLAIALVALFIPFYHNWSELTIVFLFLVLLTDSAVWKRLASFTKNRLLYPMILLYLMYGIGMIYTTNLAEGWSVMTTELPLLLFPVFLSALDYSKPKQVDFIFLCFLIGCLVAALICIGVASYAWFTTDINLFFYTDLSLFMHPSYFALYLNFILCWLYQKLIFEDSNGYLKKPVLLFLLFFINAFILMLSSRAGIYSAAIAAMF